MCGVHVVCVHVVAWARPSFCHLLSNKSWDRAWGVKLCMWCVGVVQLCMCVVQLHVWVWCNCMCGCGATVYVCGATVYVWVWCNCMCGCGITVYVCGCGATVYVCGCGQGRRKQFGFGTAKWDRSTAEGSQALSADVYISREARNIFFAVIFQLPGWGLVAPSCFALHCHCCLVSVQSVTVSLSTWKGNVRCAGCPRLLIIRRRVFRCCYSTSWLHSFLNRTW